MKFGIFPPPRLSVCFFLFFFCASVFVTVVVVLDCVCWIIILFCGVGSVEELFVYDS